MPRAARGRPQASTRSGRGTKIGLMARKPSRRPASTSLRWRTCGVLLAADRRSTTAPATGSKRRLSICPHQATSQRGSKLTRINVDAQTIAGQ